MPQHGAAMQPVYPESFLGKMSGWSDPEARLREAFQDDGFTLLGQSIVPLDGTKQLPFRLELLVRLREEEVNLQPPGAFFPALEACGMMPMLDRWVVAHACGWWRDRKGARNMVLHVNLAPQSLEERDLARYVLAQLEECQAPAAAFCFELPVTDIASASARYLYSIEKLRAAGCGIAVSGFGRDSVSLEALRMTGAPVIKMEGAMVHAVAEDPEACSRLRSVHRLCGKAGVVTVAELVERSETLSKLREIGVDYAQGYGIARPELLPGNLPFTRSEAVATLPLRRPAARLLA